MGGLSVERLLGGRGVDREMVYLAWGRLGHVSLPRGRGGVVVVAWRGRAVNGMCLRVDVGLGAMWVDDLHIPWGGRRARMGLAAVPRSGCGTVIVSVVDVGLAAGAGGPGRAIGPLVVVRGAVVFWPVVEGAIAEGGGEHERVGVGM